MQVTLINDPTLEHCLTKIIELKLYGFDRESGELFLLFYA